MILPAGVPAWKDPRAGYCWADAPEGELGGLDNAGRGCGRRATDEFGLCDRHRLEICGAA